MARIAGPRRLPCVRTAAIHAAVCLTSSCGGGTGASSGIATILLDEPGPCPIGHEAKPQDKRRDAVFHPLDPHALTIPRAGEAASPRPSRAPRCTRAPAE